MDIETYTDFIEKSKYTTCKIINENEKKYGSGFFCKIPYTNDNNILLNVLITCEHVLGEYSVFSDKNIKIIVNDKEKIISLKKNRKRWINKDLDYSCIEIIEDDNIDDYYYLDDIIFKKNYSNEMYKDLNIIILSIMKNNKIIIYDGIIKRVKNFYFIHNCNTDKGSSGSVIINKNNYLVVGIHKAEYQFQNDKNKIANIGIFMINIINDIKSKNKIL